MIVAVSDDNEARGRAAAKRFEAEHFVFDWRELVRRWRQRYRVIAVDHIGCGLSDKPQRYRLLHGDVVVWGGPARLAFHGVAPLADGEHAVTGWA